MKRSKIERYLIPILMGLILIAATYNLLTRVDISDEVKESVIELEEKALEKTLEAVIIP